MQILLYLLITSSGLGLGWALGTRAPSLPPAFFLAIALICALSLARNKLAWQSTNPGELSVAHRAWFSSAIACMTVLVGVWLNIGWSLPAMSMDGVLLDPVGALGWTPQWLTPRLHIVLGFLCIGGAGFLGALFSWAWQKFHKRPPVVVGLWSIAPFFWMSALGLLVAMSEPLRSASDHPLSKSWQPQLNKDQMDDLAGRALVLSVDDEGAAVWAHAIALRAYEDGVFSKRRLDDYFSTLAALNARRNRSALLPEPHKVGVDARAWCRANENRSPNNSDTQRSVKTRSCANLTSGRKWSWVARSG